MPTTTTRRSVTTLRALIAHDDWARDQVLEMAAPLGDEPLDRPLEMGEGSLRATLHHLWYAERIWLNRWLGRTAPPEPHTDASVADLRTLSDETAAERDAFLDGVGPGGESRPFSFERHGERQSLPLGDAMLHVCNHAVHHRAQALNMLRHVGVEPRMLDYLAMRIQPDPGPAVDYDPDTIREYLRYGDWAQDRVLEVAETLGDEALDRPFEIGPGTLRKILLHVLDAERWWVGNWEGRGSERFEKLPQTTSLAELRRLWEETAGERDAFLARHDAETLGQPVVARVRPDRELTFETGDSMLQLGGHGTHHRAQALNVLRQLGAETPALDYVTWVRLG